MADDNQIVILEADGDDDDKTDEPANSALTNFKYVFVYKGGILELHSDVMKCLQESQLINDNVIQFFCTYIIENICTVEQAQKTRLFDSIFFQLVDKTFGSIIDVEQYEKIAKSWIGDDDVFEKDWLIFPVCRDKHWLAIIVCYPGSVLPVKLRTDSKQYRYPNKRVPCILVLDSLGLRNTPSTSKIRDFLDFEWRFRGEDIRNFSNYDMLDIVPKLPKQDNTYDCGLYMLSYLRCFLDDPLDFYELATSHDTEKQAQLFNKVEHQISENSRERIMDLVQDVCTKEVY